ncbi:PTS sugar transporter subunit IIA [Anaerostipes butyraticus]|uniref:PTS sugar transporter subunit IIA n=1 Tax=Anaerostipes butyraticus TaxID=645466 RepID=UPI00320ACF2B
MRLFGRKKKEKKVFNENCVYAPVNGKTASLESLEDGMFSEKIMGDGIVVVPSDGNFKSPVAGTVKAAFPTGHAYGFLTDDGKEVLLHIGIDTVELNGKGFRPHVKQGQKVSVGDKLVTVDLDVIKEGGYPSEAILIVTSGNSIKNRIPENTEIQAEDSLMELE